MNTTTITLAASRTQNAPAFFSIFDADERIIKAAAGPANTIRALTGRGFTLAQALAALKIAAKNGTVTVA